MARGAKGLLRGAMNLHRPLTQRDACPEAPVHVPEAGLVERIVVPVSGSDREYEAQQHAVEHAAALGAPLMGLHVTTEPEAVSFDIFGYLEGLCSRWGVHFLEEVIPEGDPRSAILDALDPQDLLIMGTVRLGSAEPSNAEHILRNAPCPVQILRLGRS